MHTVTGSSPSGQVAASLAALGVAQRLLVRDLDRVPNLAGAEVVRAEYSDRDAVRDALRGIDIAPISTTEGPGRLEQRDSLDVDLVPWLADDRWAICGPAGRDPTRVQR